MKLIKTSLLAMAFMCLAASCSKDASEEINQESNYVIDLNLAMETDWVMADEILVLINEHRESLGLEAIKRDQQYASAYAVDHTMYMIDVDGINHDHFIERSQALKDRGAKMVAENVAYGYSSAEDVVRAWLNSPGHRRVIEGQYTHSGFGILKNDEGRYFYTQLFYRK
jgi:uncharacterized protein YkwD